MWMIVLGLGTRRSTGGEREMVCERPKKGMWR